MTWIVGMPTTFGYSFGLSDVRVTLADGSEVDCLQKIHQVGQFVAAGFAGSVEIGFAMLEALYRLLYLEDKTQAWDPVAISRWWPQDARTVFGLFPPEEQALQSDLLILATHPTQNDGGPWPRTYGYIFKSPNFAPKEIGLHKIGAIGSGNDTLECISAIERISSDQDTMFSIMKGEQGTHGGMGTRLGTELTSILKRVRPAGVSAHLHYCWTYREEVILKTNDHGTKGVWSWGDNGSGYGQQSPAKTSPDLTSGGAEAFRMPEVATSWSQLEAILSASGASAAGCRA